jgi:hypothetical protein
MNLFPHPQCAVRDFDIADYMLMSGAKEGQDVLRVRPTAAARTPRQQLLLLAAM